MSAFPIVHSALEGFRFTRERPRALLPWIAVVFVVGLIGTLAMTALGAPAALAELQRLAKGGAVDVSAGTAALAAALPSAVVGLTLNLFLCAVLAASAFRVLLGGDAKTTLRLGRQEARLVVVSAALGAASLGISLLVGGVSGGLGAVVGLASPAAGNLITFLGESASLALQAWVMVRLSLAAPMSVSEGRIDFRESWRRTRGQVWPMLAALLVAAALYLLVAMLSVFIAYAAGGIVVALSGGDVARMAGALTPSADVLSVFNPLVLLQQAFAAVIFALGVPILAGPLAAAYRAFTPR